MKGPFMKTARSRILAVMIAAAIVVSFFAHWDEFSAGFRDAYDPVLLFSANGPR